MMESKLTKRELAWLERFYKCMAAAPKSLQGKIGSYTIGDPNIVIYDQVKFNSHFASGIPELDMCQLVDQANAEIRWVHFPFNIDSTAG